MTSLCVYCGASPGASTLYADAARSLGRSLVEQDIALVYGGGDVGLMGVIADEVMRCGGDVTGVIPTALVDKEVGHAGLTRLHVVKDMHERKAMMASLSDGFIAMPGGMGTMEELFEVLTWSQLGFHDKPIGLLNVNGFYDGLITFVDHMVTQGFLRPHHRQLLMHEADDLSLLHRLTDYQPGRIPKVLSADAVGTLLP
ncbi:TIGR00730 family Rossman fold protein [Actimicrobium antarcticum]|uniref:LOG family protein n=1 Tax=Actimicrobium antarcticum TaxID=1051899 RepID=UPI0031D540B7